MNHARKILLLTVLFSLFALPLAISAQDATPEVSVEVIEVGQTVQGELTSDSPSMTYRLSGEPGSSVSITLISDDFDTYLVLQDADGNEVASDDDSAGNLDSRISAFTLPDSGEITVVVMSYAFRNNSGVSTGAYTLSSDLFEVRPIEYTQEVQDELTLDSLEHAYTFSGAAGDTVIIRLVSDDFDCFLILSGPGGYELISNDDGAGNLDSLIGPYVLPETGTYLITATSLSRRATGRYTLSLDRAQLTEIAYGDTVESELSSGEALYYTFSGTAGDVISISVDSDVDTSLSLNDEFNYQLAFDDDSGSRFNPEITDYVLNQTGTFTIIVQAPFGGSGAVELTLERGELPTLDDGPITLNFSSSTTSRSISFTAQAGVTYRLSVVLAGGSNPTASPSIDISQAGSSLGYISASSVRGLSADFTAESDGEVVIAISEYSYTNVALEVSVAPVE